MPLPPEKQYFRLERRVRRLIRWDRRVAAWLQGWTGLAVIVYLAKIWIPEILWVHLAAVGAGEVGLVLLLFAVNWAKYYADAKRRETEKLVVPNV